MKNKSVDRRSFIKAGLTISGTALVAGAIPLTLVADDKVDESEALAQAMGYVEDASTTDTVKFPKRGTEAGAQQFCNNCALFAGEADADFAPCSIFQNRLVAGAGWCNVWVAKA